MGTAPFIWPIRIYYSDTDAGGVVYHSNYLNFFEHARTELLRASGFDQARLMEENLVFVVSQANIDFVYPARLDQQLQVETRLSKVGAVTLIFEQQLLDEQQRVYCRAEVKVGCVSGDKFAPLRIPRSLKQELNRVG